MPLKRELTLIEALFSGIGIIVGAGIYAIIAQAAAIAGNGLWISFACAAVVAATAGLSYAELSSMYPKAGAEYDYIKPAFGHRFAFIVAWLAIFASFVGITTVAMSFGGYISAIFCLSCALGTSENPNVANYDWLFWAAVLIIFSAIVLLTGVKKSAELAVAITTISIIGLLIVIMAGIPNAAKVDFMAIKSVGGIFSAAALVFFAYIGFEEIVRLSEETKNPEKNIPAAVLLSIFLTSLLYILVAISVLGLIDAEELAKSQNPMAVVGGIVFGKEGHLLLSIIALFATASTVLLIMLATSRILYGMSNEGALPAFLKKVSKNGVPNAAVFTTAIISIAMLSFASIEFVASTVNFSIFVIFLIVNFALITLRMKLPAKNRPFKVPFSIGPVPLPTFFGIIITMLLILSIETSAVLFGAFAVAVGFILSIFYT
ncbi:MAG: APC family permease [Candidatus Diapherotrites archaeon]